MLEATAGQRGDAHGRCVWHSPLLKKFSISDITRLGFATNCDGGFGLVAIDGNLIFCRRRP